MFLMMGQNQPILDTVLTRFHSTLTRMMSKKITVVTCEHMSQEYSKIINKTQSMIRKSKKRNEPQ